MPARWAAFVDMDATETTSGPFWAAHPVPSPLSVTPALVGLPEGADARDFLDAQGLSWTHDLVAAEEAGMVIRIPLAQLPPRPSQGYDRLTVVGVAIGDDHAAAVGSLLDAHRYTRGLDLLPPGTPTNVTDATAGVAPLDIDALFDAELRRVDGPPERTPPGDKRPTTGSARPEGPTRPGGPEHPIEPSGPHDPRDQAGPKRPTDPADPRGPGGPEDSTDPRDPRDPVDPEDPKEPVDPTPPKGPGTRPLHTAADLYTASPADAVALAFGLTGEAATDRSLHADDPHPQLARSANAALWPATWGHWFTDPMAMVDDGAPLVATGHIETLRRWFVDFVRSEGPLPTLQVGRQPYGLLPVSICSRRNGTTVFDHLETVLVDLFANWMNLDSVPVLDPDASDVRPSTGVAEQASDVGAVYGATPHVRELRLRPVDDTHRELTDLYELRLGFAGLMCALMPDRDGNHHTTENLDTNAWYQTFLEHEDRARGGDGVAGQVDALFDMVNDMEDNSGSVEQEAAEQVIRTYINRRETEDGDADVITGDLVGIVTRHQGRVESAQTYLADLGVRDQLGTDQAPRLYTAAYGLEGTETDVGVLVLAPGTDPTDLAGWLEGLRQQVATFNAGGDRPEVVHSDPAPLLHQLLRSSAGAVARGIAASGLEQALARLRDLVTTDGDAAVATLERLLRATLGLAMYRVDAWMTALASERLGVERVARPAALQVGGYGWLVNVAPREGGPTQGHIHAPSLDHATTAAVLRSGWSAFGTGDAGSPLAVDLSAKRVRAARALIEGVRAGQSLGRQLGARFERRLHDRHLDAHIDDVRKAVLAGSGLGTTPPNRVVDGLLLARAYTEGIEQTPVESDVLDALAPVVSASAELRRAVDDTVADLDAVSDVLTAQAVHSLLRGDAGVAAPTLAATGSGDSGLPALDFPDTQRGGRLVTVRVTGTLAPDDVEPVWPGATSSVLAAAEPRLERWVGRLLGRPTDVVVEVRVGKERRRTDLSVLGMAALDVVYGIDRLGAALLAATGADAIVEDHPDGLATGQLGWGELVALARAVGLLLGRIRALTPADLDVAPDGTEGRDLDDLRTRSAAALALVPAGDPRHTALADHRAARPEGSVDTPDSVIEEIHIVTAVPVPVLPLLVAGLPQPVVDSFAARRGDGSTAAWMAQAAKVRPDLDLLANVVQLAELVAGRPLLSTALAQSPDPGGPWAGSGQPTSSGPHTAWCNVTGGPTTGPVAGFVVDAWTETIPARRTTSGVAVHFDRPSATAPNAVLLAVTRDDQQFNLGTVHRCVRDTLALAQFRAHSPDQERIFLDQFLPAVFLPGDTVVLAENTGVPA
jgi:hypothetical protein